MWGIENAGRRTRRTALVGSAVRSMAVSVLLLVVMAPDAAAAVPVNTVPPHVSGPPSVGATLTTTTGTWSGGDGQFAYEWWVCMPTGGIGCKPSKVSTSPSYALLAADVGGTAYVYVSAHNSSGWSPGVGSNSIGPIAVAGSPVSTAPPQLSGDPVVGATLTTTPGTWSGSVTGYAYQWWACVTASGGSCAGSPSQISGATSSTYLVGSELTGDYVYATVAAYNAASSATPVPSNVIGPVAGSSTAEVPLNEEPPSIHGQAVVGATLRLDPGSWDGAPDQYAYAWRRCTPPLGGRTLRAPRLQCTPIAGAAGATYVVGKADLGQMIVGAVSAHNAAGWSDHALSDPTTAVTQAAAGGGGASAQAPRLKSAGKVSVSPSGHTVSVSPAVSVACPALGPACRVDVLAKTQVTTHRGRKTTRKWITVGHATFTVASGKSTAVSLKLNPTGAALLRSKKTLGLTMTIKASVPTKPAVALVKKITIHQPHPVRRPPARHG